MPAIKGDFTLSDGLTTFKFKLKSGTRIYQQAISEDRALAIDISSQNRKIGEFDEQNDFRGGRGHESLSKHPDGYYDGQNAWTLNGMLMSGLQWRFAKGLRAGEDFSLPGSVSWVPLYTVADTINMLRYQSRSFVAGATVTGAGYTAAVMGFWLEKVGSPGTLTAEINNNNSGDPGTVRTTATLTAANFPNDGLSHFIEVTPTANALTNATTYHVKVYGASTDNKDNHWRIAVETGSSLGKSSSNNSTWTARNYGIYFWVASARIARRLRLFQYDGVQYAISQNDDGTAPLLYINGARGKTTSGTATTLTDSNASFGTNSRFVGAWVLVRRGTAAYVPRRITSHTNTQLTFASMGQAPTTTSEYIVYNTDIWTVLTGHGLTNVVATPVVFNGWVYFPQGDTAIIKMRFNAAAGTPAHEYDVDGTNTASLLETNKTGTTLYASVTERQIKSAPEPTAWPDSLVLANPKSVGKGLSRTNNILWDENKNALVVYKEDAGFSISPSGQVTVLKYDFENSQSYLHGVGAVCTDGLTYFTRGHSLVEEYGSQCSEIGLAWRGTGLKADRQGYFSKLIAIQGWVIGALDAYDQTSSVNVYHRGNRSYHELFQAPIAGKRVRDIQWQSLQESGVNRLWIEMDGYIVYMDFPQLTNDPYYASNVNYQHETVFESSVIDKGTSARLKKYIKELVAVTENLGSGKQIFVDYLVDDKVFSTDVTLWQRAGMFSISPEDIVPVNVWDIFKFRYRLRMITNNVNTPVVIRAIVPSGYARIPYKKQWTAQIMMAQIKATGKTNPTDLYKWLDEKAQSAQPLILTSELYPTMQNYRVVIDPPSPVPIAPQRARKTWRGVETLIMQEV